MVAWNRSVRRLRPSSSLSFSAALGTLLLGGCAQVIPWVVNPTATATSTAAATVQSLTQVDSSQLANSQVQDVDRILREHPDSENADELRQLRTQMAQESQGGTANQRDDLNDEYRRQFDRRAGPSKRSRSDRLVLRTAEQFQQPRGIRDTPRSHFTNDSLPAAKLTAPRVDLQPVRFAQ